ncbi:hypothetical protein [Varibaculum cambriense]|uniref:EF-hand domain-containing protein n=1 Tax=Varibaculum cambriense TaxID=184870 RepID=A0ABX4UNY0_9ACTO|nr:hypothetical protein [Varibaculum cambriense]PMB89405.1 hypothetical protein CJ240_06460 [Varibaculum cambriense]
MKTKTTRRILAALITIPIAISLTGCGGQDSKKSEPKKPAVTTSQSVKTQQAKEKAQAEAKAKQEAESKAKAETAAKAQPVAPAPQKPAVQQAQKPAAPARRAQQRPARQYRAPAKPAAKKPASNNSGYKLKPYEKYFDKSDMDKDGNITGGGDEFGNTW